MKQRLRVALLLDSYSLTAWSYAMVEKIMASDYAAISLLILNDNDHGPSGGKPSFVHKLREKSRYYLYDLYMRYDARKFRPPRDAFAMKDAHDLFTGIPALNVKTGQRKLSHYFSDDDIQKIRGYRPDVIIRLGFGILRGEILRAAKYGVWSYHHGDNRVNRGGPAGFWEVRENNPLTGSVLQILSEDLDNGLVIYRSYSATNRISLNLSRNNYYWKSLEFVPRKLKELYEDGEEAFFRRARQLNPAPYFYTRKLYSPRHATTIPMFGLLFKHLMNYVKDMVNDRFYAEQWFLLFSLDPGLSHSLSRFKKIIPPADRFWADPHIVQRNGKYYLFIEEFLYRTKMGHIALLEIDEKGNYGTPTPVLERPYHLSYPFVFEHDGAYYMIPESRSNGTIELYRCTSFPGKWEFVKNIMTGVSAVDTTLFHYGNTWWMFTNMITNEGASSHDELFLFYADHPLSDRWKPHRLNPVISDVTRARPAGRIFLHNGRICRPSQDCSRGYGTAVVISEVTALNRNEYRETEVCRVTPDWDKNIRGLHTFNHEGDLTVFDGKHCIRRASAAAGRPVLSGESIPAAGGSVTIPLPSLPGSPGLVLPDMYPAGNPQRRAAAEKK